MENKELNEKIADLIDGLGLTSSKFADYIDVRRPIISHIIANRNKPSLEIIQHIVAKFPEMGLEWTFDGNELDEELLLKLANRINKEQEEQARLELEEQIKANTPETQISNFPLGSILNASEKAIARIIVLYEDNTFSEIKPST